MVGPDIRLSSISTEMQPKIAQGDLSRSLTEMFERSNDCRVIIRNYAHISAAIL